MNKKTLFALLFTLSFLASVFFTNPVASVSSGVNANESQSLSSTTSADGWISIPGTNITYRNLTSSFSAHSSFQVINNGSSQDSYTNQQIQTVTLNLPDASSISPVDFIFKVQQNVVGVLGNSSKSMTMNNATYFSYIDSLQKTYNFSNTINVNNKTAGTTDTAIISTSGEYLGTFPSNNTYITATNINTTYPIEDFDISLMVQVAAVVITYQVIPNVQVNVNVTLSVESAFYYANLYNVTYNIQAEQYLAQVRDGDRMAMSVSAFKDLKMNYTETRYSALYYYVSSYLQVNMTYANNGTYVPWNYFPFSLRPAYFSQSGNITQYGVRFINTTSLMASTTAIQAFHARTSQALGSAQVNASSFVAWAVSSTPRLLAYKDGNLNNQLDLEYDPSNGLQTSSGDYIPYVGALEATKGNAITYEQTNQSYNQQIFGFQGLSPIDSNTSVFNQTSSNYNVFHYGIGNVSATPSFNTYFNGPVNNSNTYTFNFGIEYENFPVTWYNMTDGSSITSPMNISYDYVYSINPFLGTSDLSPTITYGAIVNPTLHTAMQGLSLATMYQSDFLSVAVIKATKLQQTNQNVTSSISTNFASISFAGPGNNFTNVDTGGKANYTLNGTTYKANASVLNIASFAGTAISKNVTVFQSDNQNVAGSALMKNTTITGVSLHYRQDLVVISYPEWSGGKIVHDPTFSAVYSPAPKAPEITAYSSDAFISKGQSVVLSWQTYDPNNDGTTYTIKDETGSTVASGNWNSGETITYNVNTPAVGTHTYTLTLKDSTGNSVSKTIKVTVSGPSTTTSVQSTVTPTLVSSSVNQGTSSAPGFTLNIVITLAMLGVIILFKKRRLNK